MQPYPATFVPSQPGRDIRNAAAITGKAQQTCMRFNVSLHTHRAKGLANTLATQAQAHLPLRPTQRSHTEESCLPPCPKPIAFSVASHVCAYSAARSRSAPYSEDRAASARRLPHSIAKPCVGSLCNLSVRDPPAGSTPPALETKGRRPTANSGARHHALHHCSPFA